MYLNRLTILREGYYGSNYGHSKGDPSKPLRATIEIQSVNGKTELDLGEEASARILAVISDELVRAARATAEAMTAEIISGQTLLAAE